MASIPLPALAAQAPPQQPGALDMYGKVLSLQNLLQQQKIGQLQQTAMTQENQERDQALKDQQASTAALKQWDGKDIYDIPGLMRKNGASANAVFTTKTKLVKQQADLAAADEATLKNQQTRNDLIAGHLEAVKGVPAEGKQQAYDSAITDLEQKGLVKPGQIPHQYPGDDQLDLFEKQFMGQKQLFDNAQKERETKAKETDANARATAANTGAQHLAAEMPGGPLNKVTQDIAVQTNPQIQAGKVAVATAEASARAKAETEIARGGNEALANVPKNLIPAATSSAEKAHAEFADAKSVSDRMKATMDAAHKGNVISYQIIPEEGTLQITTSQGVHRINKTEIDQYAGGGSLWQRMEGHFGHALTGKSIPDSVLNDMQEIQNIQAKGAASRYTNKLKSINQTYGSGFKPVDMGGLDSNTNPGSPSADAHPFFSRFGGTARPQ